MRDFFKPWRRKAGVVTLVMACVFAAEWVRSFYVVDAICVQSTEDIHRSIVSGSGGLLYVFVDDRIGFGSHLPHLWSSTLITFEEPFEPFRDLDIVGEFCGFEYGKHVNRFGSFVSIMRIPYWSIVTPLSLLSAWLVLNKPRQTEPKQTTEPVQAAGA